MQNESNFCKFFMSFKTEQNLLNILRSILKLQYWFSYLFNINIAKED